MRESEPGSYETDTTSLRNRKQNAMSPATVTVSEHFWGSEPPSTPECARRTQLQPANELLSHDPAKILKQPKSMRDIGSIVAAPQARIFFLNQLEIHAHLLSRALLAKDGPAVVGTMFFFHAFVRVSEI